MMIFWAQDSVFVASIVVLHVFIESEGKQTNIKYTIIHNYMLNLHVHVHKDISVICKHEKCTPYVCTQNVYQ